MEKVEKQSSIVQLPLAVIVYFMLLMPTKIMQLHSESAIILHFSLPWQYDIMEYSILK